MSGTTSVPAPIRTHHPSRLTTAERAVQLHDLGHTWRQVATELGLTRHQLVATLVAAGWWGRDRL